MMCYRDMTFCPWDDCLSFNDCPRALTDQVKKDAREWWGNKDGAPIACFTLPPDCYKIEEPNHD